MPWPRVRSWKNVAIAAIGTLGVVLAVALMALPGLWYIAWADATPAGHRDVMAGLLELSALDASWERAALRSMDESAPASAMHHATSLASIANSLQAAALGAASPLLRHSLPDVMRAFEEKAKLMGHFHKARAVSRAALRDVLAMESEMAGLVREAWREAPDRQRLVAVDNVVTQALAEAQRYDYTVADASRKNLETSSADLRSAAAVLPQSLNGAALRLDGHIQELLRAKPAEQAYFDRVRFHNAGPRVATLMRELRREMDEMSADRERYRIYLAAYFFALLVLITYLAARLIRRELALRLHSTRTPATVAGEGAPVETPLPNPADDTPHA